MPNTRSVNLDIVLTVTSSGAGIPNQQIALTDTPTGGQPIALPPATTGTGGIANSVVSVTAPGAHTFNGTFAGVPNQYAASQSPPVTLTVAIKTFAGSVSSEVSVGEIITFTVVHKVDGTKETLTTKTLVDNSFSLDYNAVAGSYTVQVQVGPDGKYSNASSGVVPFTIQ